MKGLKNIMRDNYKIIKAKVSASCKYYCSYYELNVWFKECDLNERGYTYNIGMYDIKEKARVKRGDGFKKVQAFLDSNEGKLWLEKSLYEQDLKREIDELKDSIRLSMFKMDLETLKKFNEIGKSMRKQ